MTVVVPRSGETLTSGVGPGMTVDPMHREEIGDELLLQLLEVMHLVCTLTGSSASFLRIFSQTACKIRAAVVQNGSLVHMTGFSLQRARDWAVVPVIPPC